ncbi:alkaline phosphatase family protein [Larkinella harenae]
MKTFPIRTLLFGLSVWLPLGLQAQPKSGPDELRTLVVIFDGLRSDYIRPETMPNLYAFQKLGVHAQQHHSVFPTVTRVNTSSYSTGSYPKTHGILGNSVYFPEVSANKALNTGDYEDLYKIDQATKGALQTTVSLGEYLQTAGKRMMVFSSGTTGQAFLQNRKLGGGAIINPGLILPESIRDSVQAAIGAAPAYATPNTARHVWVTNALLRYGLVANGPQVNSIWYSDPDGTAHAKGVGDSLTMQAIRGVDQQFGRVLDSLKARNLVKQFNIIVTTDHGFVTHAGKISFSELLIQKGLKASKESEDVVLADGAIYVKNHDPSLIQKIVSTLQAESWVGAIFTKGVKAGDLTGSIPGTLSFESVHWQHFQRAADILVDVNWNDEKNSAGYAGKSFARGVAGHGSLSPYEVQISLFAAGPSFKKGTTSQLPSSIIDIAPTVLHLHGLAIPKSMDGRVLSELLMVAPQKPSFKPKTERIETTTSYGGGTYTLVLHRTAMGPYQYIDYAQVSRSVQ